MSRALQLASDNPQYYVSLAGLLREARRYEEALAILNIGLDVDARHSELLENLCELYLEQGMLDDAIRIGNRLLRVSPNSLHARDILGVAYLQQGRINEALRIADQMVHLNPLDASHHFKKAVLFQQKGMVSSALHEFVRVLELEPDGEMAEDARDAIESIDGQQMKQIIMLAAEDIVFRAKLRRNPEDAARERGFSLSYAGYHALHQLDYDTLAEIQR